MASDLDRFAQAEPGTVKPETIANRLLQYKYVKEKVGMYATLLSMQQDNIVKGLEALTSKAQNYCPRQIPFLHSNIRTNLQPI